MYQNKPKMISVGPPSKKIYFFRDVFHLNKKVQILISTLIKNLGKGFLRLKNSSKTDHLSQNCGLSNLPFRFIKILFKSLLLNVECGKLPQNEA